MRRLAKSAGHAGVPGCLESQRQDRHDLFALANLYLRAGNPKDAIFYYQQAAQLDPLDVGQTIELPRISRLVGLRMPNASFAGYLPRFSVRACLQRTGNDCDKHRDLAEARKDFDRAMQLDDAIRGRSTEFRNSLHRYQDFPCSEGFMGVPCDRPPQLWKRNSSGKVDARRPPEEWSPSVTIPTEHILSRIASLHAQTFTSFRKCILTMSY